MSFKRTAVLLGLVFALVVSIQTQVLAQIIINNDNTTLKQIIIYGRHSIRSGTESAIPGMPIGGTSPGGKYVEIASLTPYRKGSRAHLERPSPE